MMSLCCPHCDAVLFTDDVHATLGFADCRRCRGIIDLRTRAQTLPMPWHAPRRLSPDRGYASAKRSM
jgi:hypothetical protein